MYNVTVMFGPRATPITLTYRNLHGAEMLADRFRGAVEEGFQLFDVEDDFGQKAQLVSPLVACVVEDLDAGVEASIERALVQTRAQAKAQIAVNSDPTVRSAAIMAGAGSVQGRRL